MSYLLVWFYKQRGASVGDVCSGAVVNVVVTRMSPPFCHVELAFDDETAISVTKHSVVSMRKRAFDPLYYTCLKIPVSRAVAIHAKSEAASRVGQRFGLLASGSTFCSRLIGEILLASNAVSRDAVPDARYLTPSALYRKLVSAGARSIDPFRPAPRFVVDFRSEFSDHCYLLRPGGVPNEL